MYQFKAKDSETKDYALCLGNISKDFTTNNIKKNRPKGNCILDIHRYLMRKCDIKQCLGKLIEYLLDY